ncbi:uncharacterized protein LOC110933626 [Helianthus annuus]|uniref:uncharacterized protein LOC110933626 n=1 Tax=Helianthus annuus TaxID=4232 RepID=UPI000B902002|nr:uncharacterized protein LOC110933626 [Helianthus annuus]
MPSPHPDNDLINENDLIAQNVSCENEEVTNLSDNNADVIERDEDGCDDECGGSKIGIGYSGDSYSTVNWFAWNCNKENNTSFQNDCNGHVPKFNIRDDRNGRVPTFKNHNHDNVVIECHDLNSAFCDEKVVCKPPVFVPELKQNRFGKFLTEEIPKFVPSHTGVSESDKEPNEESSSEDSSTTTSEGGEGNSNEDRDSDFQTYQEWESSNDSETSVTNADKKIENLEPSGVQEPTTPNDSAGLDDRDPLEKDFHIDDCTSSDDESKTNESVGESKSKDHLKLSNITSVNMLRQAQSNPLPLLHHTELQSLKSHSRIVLGVEKKVM